VSHQQSSNPSLVNQLANKGAHVLPCRRIKRTERLVEQQDLGVARHRAGQSNSLALTARERAASRINQAGSTHTPKQFEGRLPARGATTTTYRKRNIVEWCQVFEQGSMLKHHADVPLLRTQMHTALNIGENSLAIADHSARRTNGSRDGCKSQALPRP
jgi:hypothetical protein